ncbi:hypothetical protein KJS94_08255 [Flavihumibacter rivuli]|uniref:hypothetical protein n=1 Tax=Flavihumibacter rivuli TaxID=2838156 RepID=UPI001BDF3F3D|nr:hypothetical protein [Flavihumibacter rivuli]ULQ58186.1 hypothetical protein KJS94_08255 [Flavihumibacter rivuli]
MKKYFSLLALSLIILGACKTATNQTGAGLVGKLVVVENCGHYVVTLEKGNLDPGKLAANWKDDKRNASYIAAFAVANPCSFGKTGLKEGDRFSFEIVEQPEAENCAVCMMYYPTPEQKLAIKNIRKLDK